MSDSQALKSLRTKELYIPILENGCHTMTDDNFFRFKVVGNEGVFLLSEEDMKNPEKYQMVEVSKDDPNVFLSICDLYNKDEIADHYFMPVVGGSVISQYYETQEVAKKAATAISKNWSTDSDKKLYFTDFKADTKKITTCEVLKNIETLLSLSEDEH